MMRASENDCESDGERETVRGAVREGCERWRTGVNVRGRSRPVVNDHVIDETIGLWRFNYGGKSLSPPPGGRILAPWRGPVGEGSYGGALRAAARC